jgi:hypothetical protein
MHGSKNLATFQPSRCPVGLICIRLDAGEGMGFAPPANLAYNHA